LAFLYRLAKDLGMTVARLRRSLSAAEFTHWIAFYQHEAREQEKAERAARR
jgi:hypothetical protein